jgi:hypothetical protein
MCKTGEGEPTGSADVSALTYTERTMADNDNRRKGTIGLILGGIIAVAAAAFILTGGQLGGVKEVTNDADLAPVAPGKK